jgi:hypothetical protein
MNIPVNIELENGTQSHRSIDLDPASLDQAASWCGSYDILEMGQHFDAYVITPRSRLLPRIAGFALGRRYTLLPGKISAPSVHGNIGEAVAALTAVTALGFNPGDVAHIKPGAGRSACKAPDLILRTTPEFSSLLAGMTGGSEFSMPEWLPCEAKCRGPRLAVSRAIKEAKGQLTAFWSGLAEEEKGFGVAICFVHHPPQEVHVRVFLPRHILPVLMDTDWDEVYREPLHSIETEEQQPI